ETGTKMSARPPILPESSSYNSCCGGRPFCYHGGCMKLPDSEIQFQFARSSGPGGQNVNKLETKAILTWNVRTSKALNEAMKARFLELFGTRLTQEGALIIACDRFRSRGRNQDECRKRLK